jgi:tetratricopeptide (TPR) repeat protein
LTAGSAQEPELFHVDRFVSPKVRLERTVEEATRHLRQNPNDSKALSDRGLARVRLGDVNGGVEDLRHAVALSPASGETYANLAYALWIAGRLPEALEAARTALKLDANNPGAQYYAARLILDSGGNLDEAIQHLERAIELNPEEVGIRFDLFSAYRERGDMVHAGAQVRLLRLALPPDSAQLFYVDGLLAADLGHLSVAIDDFRRALAANPRLDPARLDLALALIKVERWNEAVEVLSALARDLPDSYPAAYFHALALQNTRQAPEAEKEAHRAIQLNPQSADAYTLLGILLSERGAYADAIASLQNAVRLEPNSFDAHLYLGRALYAQSNLAGARDALRTAAELRPGDVGARFYLATVLEGMGEKDAALAQYRILTSQHPQDVRGFVGLGNLLAKYGQLDEATAALEHARTLDPENFEAVLDLGRVRFRQGHTEQAIELLSAAVQRAPESVDAHYQLGLALRRAGREDEAAAQFIIVDRLNKAYRSGTAEMSKPPEPR